MPESATSIVMFTASLRTETSTWPPAGVNLIALDTRLSTSWESRARSPMSCAYGSPVTRTSMPFWSAAGCAASTASAPSSAASSRELEGEATGVDLGDEEEIADEALEPIGVSLDDAQELALLVGQVLRLSVEHELEVAADRREGSAQLVRDERDEFVLQAVELTKLFVLSTFAGEQAVELLLVHLAVRNVEQVALRVVHAAACVPKEAHHVMHPDG